MADWINDLAAALGEDPLSPDETSRLLKAARDVAHRVERRITPLATFLLGAAAGRGLAAGESRAQALERTLGVLGTLLPEASEEDDRPEAG